MKATLEFDLADPLEALALKRAITATDAYLVLYELHTAFKDDPKSLELLEDLLCRCDINLANLE
jgi:hypothetical protein